MRVRTTLLPGATILLQAAVIMIGLFLLAPALQQRQYILALVNKAAGREEACPWSKLASAPWAMARFGKLRAEYSKLINTMESDPALGIERLSSPTRPFWIKRGGDFMNGKALLAYILAEEDWIMSQASGHEVRPGDVVIDIGAHVGTFGDDALRRGAAQVIMIEPDWSNGPASTGAAAR